MVDANKALGFMSPLEQWLYTSWLVRGWGVGDEEAMEESEREGKVEDRAKTRRLEPMLTYEGEPRVYL